MFVLLLYAFAGCFVFGVAQLLAVLPDLASYSRELSMQHGIFCPMTWVVSNQRVHAFKTAGAMLKPYLSWTYTSNTSLCMQERAILHCVSRRSSCLVTTLWINPDQAS